MGKSRFEGMEVAVREQAKLSEASISEKVQIDRLQADLDSIDAETKQRIEEIKATPINKELLKAQAENELSANLKQNKRACDEVVMRAELDVKRAQQEADEAYAAAKLDIEESKAKIASIKESALERKERLDIDAKQSYEMVVSSIDNANKTLALRVQKETALGEKAKKEIAIKLQALKSRDKIVEEQKASWKQIYSDIVEISKQPPQE